MDALDLYLSKRDFEKTPEPSDAGAAQGLALRYSMQKHDATRLHFDLRLEWEGVLLSWAVTRGPSLDPKEKRLAVRTEDHPVSYLGFEGEIPEGNYGAGTVMLFDIGHWTPIIPVVKGLKKGHLHFRLHGRRLTGGWHLVRMQGKRASDKGRENWLLMKEDDDAAGGRDPVTRHRRSVSTRRLARQIKADSDAEAPAQGGVRPTFRKVQLASLSDDLVTGSGWWHELKFDGYRALIALGKGGPRVYTRNGHDWTDRFETLLPAFDEADCDAALIDGEIVAGADLQGFSALQSAIKAGGPYRYYAFDILSRDGEDLTRAPLAERRAVLEEVFRPLPPLGLAELSPVIRDGAEDVFAAICDARGEGLIAKRTDRHYRGGRGRDWLKIKCERRDEFVVIGWQRSDKRGRPFASLLMGSYEADGLVYRGKVGTGFDAETMLDVAATLKPLGRKTPPAEVPRAEARGAVWVTPSLVAEVRYAELTADRRVRHGVFLWLREDKPARTVRFGEDAMAENGKVRIAGVDISSPDRVVFPNAGVTKREVAEYCEAMADRILETAADRPLSLVRLPEGLAGERFFQKHRGAGFPDGIRSMELKEADGETADYMYVSTAAGLVGAAQMGTIEFHVWGSKRNKLERPDRLVFDLDPDEGLPFADLRTAAFELRDMLSDLGLGSWPLLTGGKGIHIVVPLRRVAEWETVKLYARIFASVVAETRPDRFTAEMSKAKRKGRIFIDWLRNERGATAIVPFSLRAREGAPAAVPVSWNELSRLESSATFDAKSAMKRDWTMLDLPKPTGLTGERIAVLEDFATSLRSVRLEGVETGGDAS